MPDSCVWAIILAGGDGTRLQGISRDESGRPAPKQYCSFGTGRSLLAHSLARARRVAAHDRILTVVADHHREWWMSAFADERLSEFVVQPRNRGTAAGILLPVWRIAHCDPGATVVVLPSDHFVEDEDLFTASIRRAVGHVKHHPEDLVLLGVSPESAASDYGWIVPDRFDRASPRRVAHFVEKPRPHMAARLMVEGGLWNSFVLASRASALLGIYRQTQRGMWDLFSRHMGDPEPGQLKELYAEMPPADFSRDILQAIPERLRVVSTPACGWTDLGSPSRLQSWRRRRDVPAVLEPILVASIA
jgi:mannose-1-phosphate guanylyltransferase